MTDDRLIDALDALYQLYAIVTKFDKTKLYTQELSVAKAVLKNQQSSYIESLKTKIRLQENYIDELENTLRNTRYD